MSLEAILQAIHAAGDAQVSQVENHAQAQVDTILASARQEAAKVKAKAFKNAVAPAAKERSRLLHQAKLEALHITGDLREALVDAALEEARRRLASLRAQAAYRDVLSRLVEEAVTEISRLLWREKRRLLANRPADRAVLDDILVELQLDLPVQEDMDCWGGLVARSEDGRVVMINTLEARLERATPSLRRSLSGLFEAEECQILTTVMPACRAMKSRLLSRRALETLAETTSLSGLIAALAQTTDYRKPVEAALTRASGMDCINEALHLDLSSTLDRVRSFYRDRVTADWVAIVLARLRHLQPENHLARS